MILLYLHLITNIAGLLILITVTIKNLFHPIHKDSAESLPINEIHRPRDIEKDSKNFPSLFDCGLILYIVGVILGSVYAKSIYGSFWVWDIKEIASLLTVILYGFALIQKSRNNPSMFRFFLIMGAISGIVTVIAPSLYWSYHLFF